MVITTMRTITGTAMLDDFFTRALIAGVGVALVAGPLGCFVVWRRMAYFGDTMAHSALLGVALSYLAGVNLTAGVFVVAAFVAVALLLLQRRGSLSTDALLGILSHATLAVGLVLLAFMSWVRVDLMGFLFGDILAVTRADIALIWAGGAAVLAALGVLWRPLLAATVSAGSQLGGPSPVNRAIRTPVCSSTGSAATGSRWMLAGAWASALEAGVAATPLLAGPTLRGCIERAACWTSIGCSSLLTTLVALAASAERS